MLKERYKRMNSQIHADEELIGRTLDAAAQPRRRIMPKHTAFRLVIGIVCALTLIVIGASRIMLPPMDVVASNGDGPTETATFLPLSIPESTPEIRDSFVMDGTTVKLLSAVTDGNQTEITCEIRGDLVSNNMQFDMTISCPGVDAALHVIPQIRSFYEPAQKSQLYLQFSNVLTCSDGSAYVIQPTDLLTLTINSYSHAHSGTIDWRPEWENTTEGGLLFSVSASVQNLQTWQEQRQAKRDQVNSLEPIYTISPHFEIVSARTSEEGVYLLTRYRFDPDEIIPDVNEPPSFAGLYLRDPDAPNSAVNIPGSSVAHLREPEEALYYKELFFPVSLEEFSQYEIEFYCHREYTPVSEEDWAITFPLILIRFANTPEPAAPSYKTGTAPT